MHKHHDTIYLSSILGIAVLLWYCFIMEPLKLMCHQYHCSTFVCTYISRCTELLNLSLGNVFCKNTSISICRHTRIYIYIPCRLVQKFSFFDMQYIGIHNVLKSAFYGWRDIGTPDTIKYCSKSLRAAMLSHRESTVIYQRKPSYHSICMIHLP